MTPLICLAVGLILYTSAVRYLSRIENNSAWREWFQRGCHGFAPDDRDAFGKHRREFHALNKRRTQAREDESW